MISAPESNLLPPSCPEEKNGIQSFHFPLMEPTAQLPIEMSTGLRQVAQVRTGANRKQVSCLKGAAAVTLELGSSVARS